MYLDVEGRSISGGLWLWALWTDFTLDKQMLLWVVGGESFFKLLSSLGLKAHSV
jgi:hypothetical protein